jgi:hypothetical protein
LGYLKNVHHHFFLVPGKKNLFSFFCTIFQGAEIWPKRDDLPREDTAISIRQNLIFAYLDGNFFVLFAIMPVGIAVKRGEGANVSPGSSA